MQPPLSPNIFTAIKILYIFTKNLVLQLETCFGIKIWMLLVTQIAPL